ERASSPTSPPFANRRSATEVHGVFTDSAISLRCVAGVRLRPSRGASFLPHRNIRTRGAAKGWEPGYRREDQAPSRGDYHSGAFRPGEWGWTGGAEGGATYPPPVRRGAVGRIFPEQPGTDALPAGLPARHGRRTPPVDDREVVECPPSGGHLQRHRPADPVSSTVTPADVGPRSL